MYPILPFGYSTCDPWLIRLTRQLSPIRRRKAILKIIHDRDLLSRLNPNRLRIANSCRTARFGMPFDFGAASDRPDG